MRQLSDDADPRAYFTPPATPMTVRISDRLPDPSHISGSTCRPTAGSFPKDCRTAASLRITTGSDTPVAWSSNAFLP